VGRRKAEIENEEQQLAECLQDFLEFSQRLVVFGRFKGLKVKKFIDMIYFPIASDIKEGLKRTFTSI
jgi:hypothetical protein